MRKLLFTLLFISVSSLATSSLSGQSRAFHALTEKGQLTLVPTLSADQFLAEHPELHDTRIPPALMSRSESEKAWAAGDQFATRFPQFERSVSNAKKMIEYMEKHDLDGTQLSSYIQ